MPTYQIEMLWDCTHCDVQNKGRDNICKSCGNPLDGTENFYMPDDISRREEVKDSALLFKANAGYNWECKFCKSHQRRYDGSCTNCTAGAHHSEISQSVSEEDQRETIAPATKPATPKAIQKAKTFSIPFAFVSSSSKKPAIKYGLIGSAAVAVIVFLFWLFTPRELDATVSSVYFQHVVHVERYQVFTDRGFDPDYDAFNVIFQGDRIHHHDTVLDGYRIEHYTERVANGQDCRTTPKTCRKTNCTSNKNGFATCGETCTGGDRVCTTRYRNESKTRDVPRYKDVPIYRPYYSWNIWKWAHHRDVYATGNSLETRWPSEQEIQSCRTCSAGEKERITQDVSYTVTFKHKDESWKYNPKSLNDFQNFPVGSSHHLKITLGSVSVSK